MSGIWKRQPEASDHGIEKAWEIAKPASMRDELTNPIGSSAFPLPSTIGPKIVEIQTSLELTEPEALADFLERGLHHILRIQFGPQPTV